MQSELITVTSDTQGPTEWLLAATGELQVCHVACAELREMPAYTASLRFSNNAGFVSKTPRLAYAMANPSGINRCICCTAQEELPKACKHS